MQERLTNYAYRQTTHNPRAHSSQRSWLITISLERAMGFEPTTASLEGWDSTTELRPPTRNQLSSPYRLRRTATHRTIHDWIRPHPNRWFRHTTFFIMLKTA